jgi:hypothetical protein
MLHREEAEGEEELPPPPPPCPPPTTIIILGGFGSRGTPYDFSIILLPLLAVFGLLLLLLGFTSCFITRFFRGEAAAAATTGGAGSMATGAGCASAAAAGKIGLSRVDMLERLLSQEVFGRRLSLVGGLSVSFSTGGTPAGLLYTSPKTMLCVSICGLCGRWEAGPDAGEASTLAGRTGGVMCFSPAVRITDAAAVFCG